ncbi:uncharacterized protein YebE (UPF0316 family) [Clostridium tetanomorphum]|uniref:DUF2179 domain-containing protein n=1 Tax=Clostridium tetanomorphum TaxID=1553 RepID=UPI000445B9F7|nr:DUF5698 domain-containing protein [Clostridium tetanomorphum]KAJ53137.1 hypothetical protein CTM_03680 [Clostridium tetanomorphum DSM 665]MBP1863101.1 uncharacterized protein YebE (UPF0316 family) [Clostridium tetanomorphum]NRS84210.1 uncharacterized protein YebE (UPF0316 family) [Clostridium tetanomorphum]SQB92523.1 Uncharacterized protein conserved in bacteria (DUF2179) [Clostridium tetanomorphum]
MMTYLLIFSAKILEVSLMTVRTVLITRGEKGYGSIIGFAEVSIWLYLVNKVLNGINEDPIRMVIYALGFACGNYLGSIIEEKLALGLLTINVIVSEADGNNLAGILRKENIGVTKVKAEGMNETKTLLMVHAKRRRKNEIVKLIENTNINSVISINDIKTVYGGYGIRK